MWLWLNNGWSLFHELIYPIYFIILAYRVTCCQPFEPHTSNITFYFITSFTYYTRLGTLQCLHALIKYVMSSRPDIHIQASSLTLHCDIFHFDIISSLFLASHITTCKRYSRPIQAPQAITKKKSSWTAAHGRRGQWLHIGRNANHLMLRKH